MALTVDIPKEAGWYVGTDLVIPFIVYTTDDKSAVQDLTGFELRYQIRRNVYDEVLLTKTSADGISVSNPTTGEGTITIGDEDWADWSAGDYVHGLLRSNDPITVIWDGTVYLNKAAVP